MDVHLQLRRGQVEEFHGMDGHGARLPCHLYALARQLVKAFTLVLDR